MNKKNTFKTLAALLAFLFASCSGSSGDKPTGRLKVVCTTGIIGDALQNICGDSADVVSIMGPGVDPHLYKASQGDVSKFSEADVVFYNGLHLEGKMSEIFEKLAKQKKVYAFADGIEPSEFRITDVASGARDPHIWFDVSLWAKGVRFAAAKMTEADPRNAGYYEANAKAYLGKLDGLHAEVKETLRQIPDGRRVLVTSHDAFGYFGRAYSIGVNGLQGVSTLTEPGLKDITDMVNLIVHNNIPAVFVESSVPRKALEAVVKGCEEKGYALKIGGELYSDALGAKGTPEGEYMGMVRSNALKIAAALK